MDQLLNSMTLGITSRLLSRLVLFAWLLLTAANSIAAEQPIIISSANSQYQRSLVQSILAQLENFDIRAGTFNVDEKTILDINNDIVISIGTEAASYLDKNNLSTPQLRVVTQIDGRDKSKPKDKFYLSMIQPVCQQFALIQALNNEWKNVSLLLSDPNPLASQELKTCASQYGLTLEIIIISQYVNIIDALNTSLVTSDVLLALPDTSVYNAKTIKSILLTTYRHRVPVIGFSESFVHAGALAAIHSSTDQLGKQVAELITKYYGNKNTGQNYFYPKYFDIAINKDVAKSLAITIPDRKVLIEKLKHENNE